MKACITHSFACDCREEKFKQLEAENAELKEVIRELSDSMAAISDLSSHMKFAAILFANKGKTISLPKTDEAALKEDDLKST